MNDLMGWAGYTLQRGHRLTALAHRVGFFAPAVNDFFARLILWQREAMT
jgi:hypothetical protein